MLWTWLWVILGLIGTGLVGLMVSSKAGKKRLKTWRTRLLNKGIGTTREAVVAARTRTPKGRMRYEQRQRRRQQPHRLTFGRRRDPGDPHWAHLGQPVKGAQRGLGRVMGWLREAARDQVERQAVAWANRQAEKRRTRRTLNERLTQEWQIARARELGLCGSTDTDDGHPCQNPVGEDRSGGCYLHPRRRGARRS